MMEFVFILKPNNAINSDSEKWLNFVGPLFTAVCGERYNKYSMVVAPD